MKNKKIEEQKGSHINKKQSRSLLTILNIAKTELFKIVKDISKDFIGLSSSL